MTDEQVDAMTAGVEVDRLVALASGLVADGKAFAPSTSIDDAMRAFLKLGCKRERIPIGLLYVFDGDSYGFRINDADQFASSIADSAALAICKAILRLKND